MITKYYRYLVLAGLTLLNYSLTPTKAIATQKAKVRMSLQYLNSGEERHLTVMARTRVEGRYQPVEGIEIKLFVIEPTERGLLGSVTTGGDGSTTLLLTSRFYQALDTMDTFAFFARLENHPDFSDTETELEITEVFLEVNLIDQDSVKLVEASVKEKDSLDTRLPQEQVEIKFLAVRPFSLLPIGGQYNTIDDKGVVTIEFPNDLPGDENGKVDLVVRISDSDLYGNVEKRATVTWGVPIVFNDHSTERSLWAAGANAPVSLLLLVNSLIIAVWGIIAYIAFRIYQIKRSN